MRHQHILRNNQIIKQNSKTTNKQTKHIHKWKGNRERETKGKKKSESVTHTEIDVIERRSIFWFVKSDKCTFKS